MRGLEGKVVVVAGAGGIGTATCVRLAEEGASVVVGDIDGDGADAVAARLRSGGRSAVATQVDISDEDSVRAMFSAATGAFGGIDAVHVNAADLSPGTIGADTNVVDEDMAVFDRTHAINLRGHVLCTRHAIPLLLARGGGAIAYTSSEAAFHGGSERPAYAASKAGINAIVRHVAARWGKEGVRANAVAPGVVITPTVAAGGVSDFQQTVLRRTPSPRLGRPEDIAAAVAFLLSEDASWINGQVLSVDGGSTVR